MARRYYLKHGGQKYYAGKADVLAGAAALANRIGRAVQVGYDETPGRKRAKSSQTYRRNPMMGGVNYTSELWKVTARGPYGQTGHAYANTEKEAKLEARLIRARGWRVTHLVRLQAGEDAPKKRRARRS